MPLCKTCKTCKTALPFVELHELHELHRLGCYFSISCLGECPRDVSAGLRLGILAGQFAVRFHAGKQGVVLIRCVCRFS